MYEDDEERELARTITENYAYLVNHISATDLIPYLLSEGVINETDKEEVEARSITIQKRGTLLDIIKRRGKRGMEVLLTALEYIEPDVFFKLTKREPRKPSTEMKEKLRRLSSNRKHKSMHYIRRLHEEFRTLTEELNKSQQDMNIVMSNVQGVQKKTVSVTNSYNDLEAELEEKRTRFNQLSHEHVSTLKDLEELRTKHEQVRRENNDYVTGHNHDMARLHAVELQHETLKIQHSQLLEEKERLNKEVADLKDTSSLRKEMSKMTELLISTNRDEAMIRNLEEELKKQQRIMDVLTRSNAEFSADLKATMEKKDVELAEREAQLRTQTQAVARLREENTSLEQKCTELESKLDCVKALERLSQAPLTPVDSIKGPFFGTIGHRARSPKSPRAVLSTPNNEILVAVTNSDCAE